jgi:hypothetical protein
MSRTIPKTFSSESGSLISEASAFTPIDFHETPVRSIPAIITYEYI